MNLLQLKDLPSCVIPNIGDIKSSMLFSQHASIELKNNYFIHKDGGVYQLFDMGGYDFKKINSIISNLKNGTKVQLYKLRMGSLDNYYICIKSPLVYDEVNLQLRKMVQNFFFGIDNAMRKVYQDCIDEIAYLNELNESFTEVPLQASPIHQYLCDYTFDTYGAVTLSSDIRTNLSYIKSGEKRYTAIMSLNNIAMLPAVHDILNGFDYLQYVNIIKPKRTMSTEIVKEAGKNIGIIGKLKPNKKKNYVRVDTIDDSIGEEFFKLTRGLYYCDVSFIITYKGSLEEFEQYYEEILSRLEQHNLILYQHSNTARTKYIESFPGNGEYGDKYTLITDYFCRVFLNQIFHL